MGSETGTTEVEIKVGAEERFLEAVEDEAAEESSAVADGRYETRYERREGKNKAAITRFLGQGRRVHEAGIVPRYYGELLTWALKRYIEKEGWQVAQVLGYHKREPLYLYVSVDPKHRENLLVNGQILAKRGNRRLIITVDIDLEYWNSILVEGPARRKKEISEFVAAVLATAWENNFYRGKKIEFGARLRFLDLTDRSWEGIILDAGTKREIRANTVDFLSKTELWAKLGIPPKRGILLAGEPGTGKTIICKALMAEAEGMTCITTNAYALSENNYITELYDLARDLAPCLVFIEDIDLIGQNREEFGYQKGPALLSLLAVLDGVEEKKGIITVATTNCLETLDKALAQRPARFDRVIRLTRPVQEQRREIVDRLCERIPLEESTRDYIVRHSDGCTPAQLQEIIFSLAIEHVEPASWGKALPVSTEIIDRVISKIDGRGKPELGFKSCNNGLRSDVNSGHQTLQATGCLA